MFTKYKIKIAVGGLIVAGIFGGNLLFKGKTIPENLLLKAPKDKIVFSKQIKECFSPSAFNPKIVCTDNDIISYDYISTTEVKDNVIFSKGNYSNAVLVSEKGNKKTVNFYSGSQFYKDTTLNKVFLIKHGATTTPDSFKKQTVGLLDKIFGRNALATDYYTTAGDGYVESIESSVSWAAAHDCTDGRIANYTSNQTAVYSGFYGGNLWWMYRAFFPIDTSALGAGVVVSAASLNAYADLIYDDDNDGKDYLAVVQTFQTSTTQLDTTDIEDCGSDNGTAARAKYTPIQTGSDKPDISNISVGWVVFTFNDTGIGWINKTGITLTGLREGHDIENEAPATMLTGVYFETSEGANVPYLTIIYTTPSIAPVPIPPQAVWW